jgi:hypothetical protein
VCVVNFFTCPRILEIHALILILSLLSSSTLPLPPFHPLACPSTMLGVAASSSFHVSIGRSLRQKVEGPDIVLIAAATSLHAISIHGLFGKDARRPDNHALRHHRRRFFTRFHLPIIRQEARGSDHRACNRYRRFFPRVHPR